MVVGGAVLAVAWTRRTIVRLASAQKPMAEVEPSTKSPVEGDMSPLLLERTGAERIASVVPCTVPECRFDRRFLLVWALPLIAITVIFELIAYLVFIDAYPGAREPLVPATPKGGVLLLIDANARGLDSTDVTFGGRKLAVAATAETWTTGVKGVNELLLKLTFSPVAAGSRWYVVASGQYFPDQRLDRDLFCDTGFFVVQEHDRIRCRDSDTAGSVGIEYRYSDKIGAAMENKINVPIDSLNGFDAKSAAVITGTISADTRIPTRISIPYRSPRVEHSAGDELVRFAPVGVTDQEWGGLRSVRDVAAGYADVFGEFADVQSGQKLRYIPLSTIQFSVREDALNGREIAVAMPPTAQPDKLVWENAGASIGPISYRLHDPRRQDRAAIKAFLAGVIASAGAAALLMLLEQALLRCHRQT